METSDYKNKYLKYKSKYLKLKSQRGGFTLKKGLFLFVADKQYILNAINSVGKPYAKGAVAPSISQLNELLSNKGYRISFGDNVAELIINNAMRLANVSSMVSDYADRTTEFASKAVDVASKASEKIVQTIDTVSKTIDANRGQIQQIAKSVKGVIKGGDPFIAQIILSEKITHDNIPKMISEIASRMINTPLEGKLNAGLLINVSQFGANTYVDLI